MARKIAFDYAAKAAELKKYGFAPKYGKRNKSPAAKAAVTRQWNKIKFYAVEGKAAKKNAYKFKFVAADTAQKVKAMEGLNPKVRTPKGFFVRVPTNAKAYKVKFDGGALRVEATGARGGKRTEKIFPLNASALAKNPRAEIERVTGARKGKFLEGRLVVNGMDAHRFEHSDLRDFENYFVDFFTQSQNPKREGVMKSRFHGKKLTARQFTDIFHVKIITQKPSHNGPTKSGKKTKPKRRK